MIVRSASLDTLERGVAIGIVDHQAESRSKPMNVAVGGSHGEPFGHERREMGILENE